MSLRKIFNKVRSVKNIIARKLGLVGKRLLSVINKLFIALAFFLTLILLVVLLEIPIPFLATTVNNFLKNNYPAYFVDGKNIELSSVSLGWNEKINRPILLLKDLSYKDKDNLFNISKIGFYFSIKDLILNKKASLIKLYLGGLEFKFSEAGNSQQITNANSQPEITIINKIRLILNNKPHNNIKNTLAGNDFLKKINQIAINDIAVLYTVNNTELLFNMDDFNFLIANDYNLEINTSVSVNKKTLIEYLNLKANLSQDNTFTINTEFKELRANEFVYVINDIEGSNVINTEGFIFNNTNLNGNVKLNYLNKINSITGTLQANDADIYIKDWNNEVQLNYFKMAYNYSGKDSVFKINTLEANFKQLSIKHKTLQQPVNVQDANYTLEYNLKDNTFKSNLILTTSNLSTQAILRHLNADNKTNIKIEGDLKDSLNFNATVSHNKISYATVLANWPTNLDGIKAWLEANVVKSYVNNIKLNVKGSFKKGKLTIDDYIINSHLTNTELTYVKGLPKGFAKELDLLYQNNEVKLDVVKATTGNIAIDFATVKLFNSSNNKQPYTLAVEVDVEARGKVEDGLSFINQDPLKLLASNNINPKDFEGSFNGKLSLLYDSASNGVTSLNFDSNLENLTYKNFLFNHPLQNFSANLSVSLDELNIVGSADYLNTIADFKFKSIFNDTNIAYTVDVGVEIAEKNDLITLDILPAILLENISSFNDINFVYTAYKDAEIYNNTLDFIANLSGAEVNIKHLNYRKPINENLIATGILRFLSNGNIFLDVLKLQGDKISGQADVLIDTNKVVTANFYNVSIANNANFNARLITSKDNLYVRLNAELIDLSYIAQQILSENPSNNKDNTNANNKSENLTEDNEFSNYDIELEARNITVNKLKIADTTLKVAIEEKKLKEFNFLGRFDSKKQSNIDFIPAKNTAQDESQNSTQHRLRFDIYNAGYMFEAFGISKDVSKGELRGDIIINQDDSLYLEGQLLMHDFTSGVPFANASLKFKGNKNLINISELLLNGNIMGGSLTGTLKGYKSLALQGELTLIWSTLSVIVNLPVIKQLRNLLKLDNISGLAGININISGDLGDLKYTIFTAAKK